MKPITKLPVPKCVC